jgi:hypothetical protein
VAEETDAARQRVLAARADLATELDRLEASARAAVDIPARVRRNPAKAAAIVGGAGFVALGGPKRLFKRAKAAIVGPEPELPERLLPEEIEKALRKLGNDGEKVRGTIERDFADYVEAARKKRGPALQSILTGALARPLLTRGAKAAAEWFARTDETGFQAQLERIRARGTTGEPTAATGGATATGRSATGGPDTEPTGR